MRFAEPVAISLIYPFINRFIEDLHVTDDPSRIGYYAGIIVRSVSLGLPPTTAANNPFTS